ncbi:MAG: putative transport system permease protein [Actinomycetota bacterium]
MQFVIVALLLVSIVDAIRNPTIRRLALRNVTRRRGEAMLVILGSLLGTAIITAAFIVGDTLGASVRDHARTDLGPIDESVRAVGLGRSDEVLAKLQTPAIPGVDGYLKMTAAGVSIASVGPDRRAEPFAAIHEVDFDQARAFGGDAGATGMARAGATPTGDEAVVSKALAHKLKVAANDKIEVFGYGHSRQFTVRQVIADKGIAGGSCFVPIGTVAGLAAPTGAGGALGAALTGQPPSSTVLVSNDGGVFEGAKHTDAVTAAVKQRLAATPSVEVFTAKQDLLDNADDVSKQFRTIFSGIGAFSVIAGILLLVNIFVMLADERKSELGMLRAIGLKRNQLVRAFGMEGAVYSVVSSLFGVIAGVGVGRLVAVLASGIFNRDSGFGRAIHLQFSLKPSSLILGFMIGAFISLVTVWGTSIRLGRLNVIRAIRDIAAAPADRARRLRTYVLSALGIVVGLVMFQAGVARQGWFGVLAGVPIASVSSIALLRGFLPRRVAVAIGCGVALVWGIAVFTLFPDALSNTEFFAFVTQGVILVGSATAIVATNDDVAIWAVSKLGVSRRTLAARLGFAYPLARVFRTSMLLGMYAIVVFTLTFLSVFSHLFSAQAPKFAQENAAGYQVLVDSNYANPVPASVLAQQRDVTGVATLDRASPEWTTPVHPDRDRWTLSGYDDALLAHGVPTLNERLPRFHDDRAVWQAVMHDPSLIIVPNIFLQRGGPPASGLKAGDKIHVFDTLSGKSAELTIAGKIESDFTFNGPYVGKAFLHSFTTDFTPSRHFVEVAKGADASTVAARIEGKLLDYGVQADTFQDKISEALSQQNGFLSLMQGYLGLGLVIGIAGLGVVMVRAVRERRRQIGMLRAMGFPSRIVRQMFLTEASFLAVQGIVLGTVLALITSYNLLTHSSTFGGQSIGFQIPVVNIAIVSAIALVASLAASAYPANQASKIRPAVALRIAD